MSYSGKILWQLSDKMFDTRRLYDRIFAISILQGFHKALMTVNSIRTTPCKYMKDVLFTSNIGQLI